MPFVLTLIAAPASPVPGPAAVGRVPEGIVLNTDAVDAVRQALSNIGAEPMSPQWLSPADAPGAACDIPFADIAPDQAESAAKQALSPFYPEGGIDVIAQSSEGRKKSILIADMDSTIVTSETLDDLAEYAGIKDHIAAITARAMNGELDFREALNERVGLLKGLSSDTIDKTFNAIHFTPGARTLVQTMKANGATCVLISGGFTVFADRVGAHCGFDQVFANTLGVAEGALTGIVHEPIVDKDTKRATLIATAKDKGVSLEQTVAVGDGANDLPMLQTAGFGVAFHGKPTVVAGAPHALNATDLTGLLFAQGYRLDEFVTD
jgi:phosphoserine phosphatase